MPGSYHQSLQTPYWSYESHCMRFVVVMDPLLASSCGFVSRAKVMMTLLAVKQEETTYVSRAFVRFVVSASKEARGAMKDPLAAKRLKVVKSRWTRASALEMFCWYVVLIVLRPS